MTAETRNETTQRKAKSLPVTGVDCHAHVMLVDAPLAAERHSAPQRDIHAEEYIALLDRHGLSHGVLTQPSFYGTDNSLILAALAKYPERLRGTAIVSPETGTEELSRLREAGIAGIRFNWFKKKSLPDVGAADFQAFLGRIRDAGLHAELYLEGARMAGILPLFAQSGVRLVIDHFGSPEPEQGVECAGFQQVLKYAGFGQAFVKLSAPYRLGGRDPQPYVDALMATGGPGQLLWASDWPWVSHEEGMSYQKCIDDLSRWVADEIARTIILCVNPKNVFFL
ncbi:amidohydrolase [Telmatospirillum sp. J64-1]|uniref:amidohydrolase family protein n=1 Tax=Telmatospirillum sp. J64-1 TaxID=2502183 RepID=UPI00115DED06|nr:amidohydrolase family protein [Telmatospirillum sp. J64-1]